MDDIGESCPELHPLHQHDKRDNIENIVGDFEIDLDIEYLGVFFSRITRAIFHLINCQDEPHYKKGLKQRVSLLKRPMVNIRLR